MGELSHLADELAANKHVVATDMGSTGLTVGFNVDCGEYDSLASSVITILGRYDVSVYPGVEGYDYVAVVG